MNKRDMLQEEWANSFMKGDGKSILHLCPRSGKIRTSIRIFKKIEKLLGAKSRILIAYPDKNIQQDRKSVV